MPLNVEVNEILRGQIQTFPPIAEVPPPVVLSEEETLEALMGLRFKLHPPIPKPDPVISLQDHTLATGGNILTVAGQVKAGKSGVIAAILVGVLSMQGDITDLLGLTVKKNNDGKAILHVDGEQSRYDHYRGIKSVLSRTSRKNEPDWFYSFNFRTLEVPERVKNLKLLCEVLAKRHNGIHLIILDGGADFVLDTNDPKESNEAVQLLESLAILYNCPVVVVLHFNPGTEKGRGHYGSQLERKSESVISVSKDKDSEISTVEGKFLRNSGNIPNIHFIYDVEKGHHVYHSSTAKSPKGDKAEAKRAGRQELAERIFEDGLKLFANKELCEKIMERKGIERRQAQTIIKEMLESEIISFSEGDSKYFLVNGTKAPPF